MTTMHPASRANPHDALSRQAASLTIGDCLLNQVRLRPDHPAVQDGARRLNFRQFNERVNRPAHMLTQLDIGRGDRMAILAENRQEHLEPHRAGSPLA